MKANQRIHRVGRWGLSLLGICLILSIATPAYAAVTTVGCDADDLISAIANANASPGPDTLELSSGCTYALTSISNGETIDPNGLPVITGDLTLNGNGATITRAEGAPKFRFFRIQEDATLTLHDLTLVKGELEPASTVITDYYGGAVFNMGTLTLADCVVQDNWAHDRGGAIYNDGGMVAISDSTFSGNGKNPDLYSTSLGAAIYSKTGMMTINASEFVENQAADGGGAVYSEGSLTVAGSRFVGNVVEPSGGPMGGGAIFSQGDLNVSTSTFDTNSAMRYGGALFIEGTGVVSNSTFVRNSVIGLQGSGGGGAIYGSTLVENSTFYDNFASIYALGAAILDGGTISNSTFSANKFAGPFSSGIHNATLKNSLVHKTTCKSITDGGGNLYWPSVNNTCPGTAQGPQLGPLRNNGGPTETMALSPDSPAINAAINAGCPAADQRGVVRPQGKRCDIGAFELEIPTAPTLLLPADNKKMTHSVVNLRWEAGERVAFYRVLVSQDSTAGTKVVNLQVTPTNYKTPALEAGHWYYWRIKACSNVGCASSEWWRFRVK